MSDLKSDTYWSDTINIITQEQVLCKRDLICLVNRIASIQFDVFKLNIQFCSNIALIVATKLIENAKTNNLTVDECAHIDQSLELIIRNLILSRSTELDQDDQALSLTQFLNLLSSLLTCESFICNNDVQMATNSLKNIPIPEISTELTAQPTINSLLSNFLKFGVKLDSKSDNPRDVLSKMVLKHIYHNNGFNLMLTEFEHNLIYLNVYRKNHLKQFNSENFKSMNQQEALQAKANLANLLNDISNLNKYIDMLNVCLKLNTDYVKFDDEKLYEFVQSVQIAMFQTCLAEFVLSDSMSKQCSRPDETCLDDLLNLIQLSGDILSKYQSLETSPKNTTISCFYLEKIIECQNNQILNYKQSVQLNEMESNESIKIPKLISNVQLNNSLNHYILFKHLVFVKNSVSFEHLFTMLKNAFNQNLIVNQNKRKNRNNVQKQSNVLNLNQIKNIDDTDEENYEEDEDTVATTVTTYTNITNTQANNLDDDDSCLLIGSWFYEQINSSDAENPKEKETEVNMSNSTQILDTTFDLDTENNTEMNFDELISQLIDYMQDLILNNTSSISISNYYVQEICTMLADVESSKSVSENAAIALYNFVKFLLIKNLINSEKQTLIIEHLGLKDLFSGATLIHPLSQRYLALLSLIFMIKFRETTDLVQSQAINIWMNFLSNITENIKSNKSQEISMSCSCFLLLIFHNLSKENKLKILLELSKIVQDIDRSVVDKRIKLPLLVSRVIFLIDYILNHFEQTSSLLLRFVESTFLFFRNEISTDYESEHERFLNFIEPTHSDLSFYSLKNSQKLQTPKEFYDQSDYTQFYQSLINLREYGSKLRYTDSDLVEYVSISYLSHLIDDLTHPLNGLKPIDEVNSNQVDLYQKLRRISAIQDDQSNINMEKLFTDFWNTKSNYLDLDLLMLNIDLLAEHKSNLELSSMEPTFLDLISKLNDFYINDLFLNYFERKDINLEPKLLGWLISLAKYSDQDQDYFINLEQEDQLKSLSASIKGFNESVSKKFELMKNFNLKNMNWYCPEVRVIRCIDKLLSLWLDFNETNFLDKALSNIYSNMSLLAPYLAHYLKKKSKKINFNQNYLVHSFLIEYYLDDTTSKLDDKIVLNLLKQVENSLDQTLCFQNFLDFYQSDDKLFQLLTTLSSQKASKMYLIQLVSILNKLLRTNMSAPSEQLSHILSQLNQISTLDQDSLQKWFLKLVCNQEFSLNEKFQIQQFVIYLISDSQRINESVCLTILNTIIQLSNNLIAENASQTFPDLVCLMDTLSSSGTGLGYLYLFKACIIWIEFYTSSSLIESKANQKSVCYILSYLISILNYIKPRSCVDTSELAKYYQDSLLIDFEKQILKLFETIEKKSEFVCDEQDDLTQANDCDLLETEIYENNPTIDDTCNDQDLDDNFELNRENSEDDEDDEENEFEDEDDEETDEQFQQSEPSLPVPVPAEPVSNANLDINELFGAYGVTYQIFDESGDVLRNDNHRLEDVIDEDEDEVDEDPDEEEDDDDDDDEDDEYGDDFTDNFVDYDNPNTRTEPSHRNVYQNLISSFGTGSINFRQSSNVPKVKKNDDDLNSKLCTYTITKKEFMNQHWYYCHTCKMVDRIGMCTVCAKVCHADHDVSYAKFGSFFCDCGAKEDASCKALQKRIEKKNPKQKPKRGKLSTSSSPTLSKDSTLELLKKCLSQARMQKALKIEKLKNQLLDSVKEKNLSKLIREFLTSILVPESNQIYESSFLKSNTSLAKNELNKLHANLLNLTIEQEQLFQVTLGSQEGAFENVRLTYTGDHGLLIKQLIQNCSIRRVSMCLVTSRRRQNLIVTHEKGKSSHLTILQLNALLKQDSNKRNKLTLTKLNTIPVPFTLITVSANPHNEDYVSLTGLKDCYIMYLNENGQQNDPNKTNLIVLHPSLETSNYIIKSVWLPACKTQLALITSEFIKIYDLSIDKISPMYYFVLPMGKVKDATFYYNSLGQKYLLIITSDGFLYFEELNDVTSAKNGIYYVTNTIELAESNPNGVSIYYSFKLDLLFWSHQNSKTFVAKINAEKQQQLVLSQVTPLSLNKIQPLCNWSEIASHPGLIMANTQTSNNPIVFMFKPDAILYQEIKMINNSGLVSKAKIQDMVAVRHLEEETTASDEEDLTGLPSMSKEKTTMIVLCDDGSLKIYVADPVKSDYWLAPYLRPTQPVIQLKSIWSSACLYQLSPHVIKEIAEAKEIKDKRCLSKSIGKKCTKLKLKAKEKSLFPIDYFEKCVQIKDVEFGGQDLIEIYNSSQIKIRLSDTNSSKYISIKKMNNFKIEISNINDSNRTLLMGVRIMCGINSIEKCPSYFEVFGRRVYVKLDRARWFDVCLTREEAFVADNKLVVVIGSSCDPSGLTSIDAVHAYGKSKTELNWTKNECVELQKKFVEKDKKDDIKTTNLSKKQTDPKKSFMKLLSLIEPKPFDYVLSQTIDLYELCGEESQRELMSNSALNLLCKILPPIVLYKVKSLLLNSVETPAIFSRIKIDSILALVTHTLNETNLNLIDCEIFEKCLVCLKSCLNSTDIKLKNNCFFSLINKQMWQLISLNESSTIDQIGRYNFSNLTLVVESLIEIEHFFMLTQNEQITESIIESYLKLLTSDSLEINFTARRVLINLLKPGTKKTKTDENDDFKLLIQIRKLILQKFTAQIPKLKCLNPNLDGLKSIAFYQVIISLLSDLSAKDDADKKLLDMLIANILNTLLPFDESDSSLIQLSPSSEIKLIALRTLSILLSKSKYQRSGTETCNFIIQSLVSHLIRFNLIDKCLNLLKFVLKMHWSTAGQSVKDPGLIKVCTENLFYEELSPFFVKIDPMNKDSFVIPPPNLALQNENSNPETNTHIKLFDNYIELFSEILIRLPYQMKKLCLGSNPSDLQNQINSQFNFSHWCYYLCEYLQLTQCNYLKRLIKKLLQILCGSKDKYRKFKDQHILSSCLSQLVSICPLSVNPKTMCMLDMGFSMSEALDNMNDIQSFEQAQPVKLSKLTYLNLVRVIENFKLMLEVAGSRSSNWQKFCIQNPSVISYLIEMCLLMGIDSNGSGTDSSSLNNSSATCPASTSAMAPTILQMLQSLFGVKNGSKSDSDEMQSQILVGICFKQISKEIMLKFVRTFLLEAFQPQIRWSMHTLVYNLFKNSTSQNQLSLYEILWSLWSDAMSLFGSKAAQYCDLMGFFVLKLSNELYQHEYVSKLVKLYLNQNDILQNHCNSLIYDNVAELDGFFMESDPCFICNNLDQPIQTFKLNSIKIDTRFTTNQQIYKLASTYSVQKILFKIADIRKTKMIQCINVYFTNRTSHSIVDLKMNLKLWSKAKQIRIEPGQSEVKIELQLPIICSNLMFEYADFYDRDSEKTSESAILQCPRCSASVPAHPGVCNTCGENVFQCHKCRAINYDERDPFLCNSCGFCKFAKFDINLVGRQIVAIDPIESEDDRKTTVQNMNNLLDRADKIHSQISHEIKPLIEAMIIKQEEQSLVEKFIPNQPVGPPPPPPPPPPAPAPTSAVVNPTSGSGAQPGIIGVRMAPLTVVKTKNAVTVSQKYSECRTKFDELAKIVLKLNLYRKELREYDKQFKSDALPTRKCSNAHDSTHKDKLNEIYLRSHSLCSIDLTNQHKNQKCYGCASACLEHCFNAFRVILCSSNSNLICLLKIEFSKYQILEQMLNFNLKRNLNVVSASSVTHSTTPTPPPPPPTTATTASAPSTAAAAAIVSASNQLTNSQKLVDRDLINIIYMILKDNVDASNKFDKMVKLKLKQMIDEPTLNMTNLKYELIILSSLVQKVEDSCWLMRLRLVVHILMQSLINQNAKYMDELSLPCLRILSHLVKSSTSGNNNKKIDLPKLLDPYILFNTCTNSAINMDKLGQDSSLKLKYFFYWKEKKSNMFTNNLNWLQICLFCSRNRSIRQLTSSLIQNLYSFYLTSSNDERKYLIVDFIGQNVDKLWTNDDNHLDYFNTFKFILQANDRESKYRLVVKHKSLAKLELLILKEIKHLSDIERLANDSISQVSFNLSFDLNRGLCIKTLGELLSLFLKEPNIKTKYKSRLIATVLNAYLSLKKLLYQRTRQIDEAQEKLLTTLEQLTSGTEQETRHFMSICIDTVHNFDLDDLVTPVFIFERLSNIIYPEDVVDNKEFLIILEKDPNQEDYLQGRMLGNPYSSNDPGLGPLMRNIKNKICTDSELIALLEDDNGMELLVNNKIISLDLSVRDVYKKVWLSECISEHEPMRIVYRMTGLLGDATEDIIDNLEPKKTDSAKDDEQVYRMADELAYNGALPVMLERLNSINQQNFTIGKPLLRVLLKLFDYALKLKLNRTVLIKPQLKTISTMLQTLNMMLKLEVDVSLTEKLISIMQVILSEASKQPLDVYNEFSALCGDREQLEYLLSNIKSNYVRGYSNLMQALMGLIPFLSFGDETKMKSLIEYFSTYITNFDQIDKTSSSNEDILHLECFCVIVNGIEIGQNGTRLRDMMNSSGIVQKSIDYLLHNSPNITTYFNSDNDLWKDFIKRKSLPYALRILTGLSKSHMGISDSIANQSVPILHKLEQFTSENLVGVIAEDLLAVLRQSASADCASTIEQIQKQTKNEKKKLAMAKRNKQLNQLGMKTNDKGQLLMNPDSLKLHQVEEEKGHVCCICRDGYKYNPQKLLAIYTFSKKCDIEPNESKARKTVGFSTVTHFNLVHIDCHTNAIRSSRTCRDEWENAALQNANTKCNGILPIWGPDVTETLFSNALARHNNYLLDATGIRDLNYTLYVHDLKILLNRFAENLSFSEDTGGGGRESNINLVPYIIHAILYSVNTAKYVTKEEQNLHHFLDQNEKLVQNSFECENVFYYMSMSLCIMRAEEWKLNKLKFLKRTLLTVHARLANGANGDKTKLASTQILDFKKYKPCLLFIGLVSLFYKHLIDKIPKVDKSPWTEQLANYIRHNDVNIMEYCKKILQEFEEELMVSEDWLEMFDVLGFMREFDISDPVEFMTSYLQTV